MKNQEIRERVELIKRVLPKLKSNNKINKIKIEALEWELKYKELLLQSDVSVSDKEIEKIAIDFANWKDKLSPNQMVSVWSKDGQRGGLFNMDNEQLFKKFTKLQPKKD